jgi:hypothetical protein
MAETQARDRDRARVVGLIANEVRQLSGMLERATIGPARDRDPLAGVHARLNEFLKSTGHYPGFLDVGINVYLNVYDWHVRNHRPILINKMAEQRSAIQYMYTQLILRWEVPDPNFLGIPYD